MTERRAFYVTIIRDRRVGWLFGPIADHGLAISLVPYMRDVMQRFDPFTTFDSFGTSSIVRNSDDTRPFPIGQINHIVGRKDYLP
jgi:hypothetical protein